MGGGSIMVWVAITNKSLFDLVPLEGTRTAAGYRNILSMCLLPLISSLRKRYPGKCITFQYDNAPVHTAHVVEAFLADHRIRVMKWPPNCLTSTRSRTCGRSSAAASARAGTLSASHNCAPTLRSTNKSPVHPGCQLTRSTEIAPTALRYGREGLGTPRAHAEGGLVLWDGTESGGKE